jgi:hypothetical protein
MVDSSTLVCHHRAVDDETRGRLGRNEALFREVNEAIERGLWPGDQAGTVRFRCECARFDCNEPLELPVQEYERIRANARRFFVTLGHELPDAEEVVETHAGYLVVEKRGQAGAQAKAEDPRD